MKFPNPLKFTNISLNNFCFIMFYFQDFSIGLIPYYYMGMKPYVDRLDGFVIYNVFPFIRITIFPKEDR